MTKFLPLIAALFLIALPAAAQERVLPQSQNQMQLSFSPVVKKVSPAVVNIYTKRMVTRSYNPFAADPFFGRFFGGQFGGRMKSQLENSLGSGAIVQQDGLVVTNAHVVKDAQEITVALSDGREFAATLSLVEEASDLALLRITEPPKDLPFITLKPSETLEVGDIVLAIGNPFGVGQTVTSGIVSALARSEIGNSDSQVFIQTDAAI
ncbi:MAG TPA: trypsin-like peptidase domain-containing protein, partial [Alphaproteobacteria bacterium]|nr:trypsin-like peptidase domain-containing protein [Alphaproteobacteria bacterium]